VRAVSTDGYVAWTDVCQNDNPDDVTSKELGVIAATGDHPNGEKALADLRKRKLITSK
jgi:hypothetical protein